MPAQARNASLGSDAGAAIVTAGAGNAGAAVGVVTAGVGGVARFTRGAAGCVAAGATGAGSGWALVLPVALISTSDTSKQRVGVFTTASLPQKLHLAFGTPHGLKSLLRRELASPKHV